MNAPADPLALLKAKWPYAEALWSRIEEMQGHKTFVMSFSRGKESVVASLRLKRGGYGLVPFFCYDVPGLTFVEEMLDYYERRLFDGQHIVRVPHPNTFYKMKKGVFHPPHWLAIDEGASLETYGFGDIQVTVALEHGLPKNTWTAIGVRAQESTIRRKLVAIHGPVKRSAYNFSAIWELSIEDLEREIRAAQIKLPPDYHFMPRSYEGLRGDALFQIKHRYPADYRKVLEYFPLVEAEVFRYELTHGKELRE